MPETPRRWRHVRRAWALLFLGLSALFVVAVSFFAGAQHASAAGLGDLGGAISGVTSAGGDTIEQAVTALPVDPVGPAPVPVETPPAAPIVDTVIAPVADVVAPTARC